jgi:hypothetical protein
MGNYAGFSDQNATADGSSDPVAVGRKTTRTKYQDYVNFVTRTRARRAATRQSSVECGSRASGCGRPASGLLPAAGCKPVPADDLQQQQQRASTSIHARIDPS